MSNPIEVYWLCGGGHDIYRQSIYSGDDFKLAQLHMKAAMEGERPEDAYRMCMDVNKLN